MPRTKLSECGKKRKLLSVSRHWSARASIFLSLSLAPSEHLRNFPNPISSERNFQNQRTFSAILFSPWDSPFRIRFKVKKQSYSKILETSRMPEANWNNTYFISMFAILCWVLLEVTSKPCLCATQRHTIKFQFQLMPSVSNSVLLNLCVADTTLPLEFE